MKICPIFFFLSYRQPTVFLTCTGVLFDLSIWSINSFTIVSSTGFSSSVPTFSGKMSSFVTIKESLQCSLIRLTSLLTSLLHISHWWQLCNIVHCLLHLFTLRQFKSFTFPDLKQRRIAPHEAFSRQPLILLPACTPVRLNWEVNNNAVLTDSDIGELIDSDLENSPSRNEMWHPTLAVLPILIFSKFISTPNSVIVVLFVYLVWSLFRTSFVDMESCITLRGILPSTPIFIASGLLPRRVSSSSAFSALETSLPGSADPTLTLYR